jgi:hypothetical protein
MTTNRAPRSCSGPGRRAFLKLGSLGFLGLGLDDWLRLRAQAGAESAARRHCILIWLAGGPSHLDTFDPKPGAPVDVRGEFKPISTAVPGLAISEILPNLARLMNRLTLIRSMTSPEADHSRATHHLLTGNRPSPALIYPSFGSVVARVRSARKLLPDYTAIPEAPLFSSSGYLSSAYDPFAVVSDPNSPGFRIRNLTPPDRLTMDRLARRRDMVRQLDEFAREAPPSPLSRSRDQFSEAAFALLTSRFAQKAFDLNQEKDAVRDRYGRTSIGQSCLLARRLVEANVSFVTVNDRGTAALGWDTHQQNFSTLKGSLAPQLDQAVSALIEDLSERGLLDQTLVVMMGEFGRTPRINQNAGRDHHGRANSIVLAGAGLPGGCVIGRTDDHGDSPVDRPVTPADLAAVLFRRLGVDPEMKLTTSDGRPVRLVEGARPPSELI